MCWIVRGIVLLGLVLDLLSFGTHIGKTMAMAGAGVHRSIRIGMPVLIVSAVVGNTYALLAPHRTQEGCLLCFPPARTAVDNHRQGIRV